MTGGIKAISYMLMLLGVFFSLASAIGIVR